MSEFGLQMVLHVLLWFVLVSSLWSLILGVMVFCCCGRGVVSLSALIMFVSLLIMVVNLEGRAVNQFLV